MAAVAAARATKLRTSQDWRCEPRKGLWFSVRHLRLKTVLAGAKPNRPGTCSPEQSAGAVPDANCARLRGEEALWLNGTAVISSK